MTFEINTPNGPAFQSPYGPILLEDIFDVDADGGVLIWKARPVELFASRNAFGTWNTRYAGALALASIDGRGYLGGDIFGKAMKAHRIIFSVHNNRWPLEFIDHINGVKIDNRASNLRGVSNSENQRNASIRVDNTSGVSGVYWDKAGKKWRARIREGGTRISLGCFTDIESATIARKAAEVKFGYHENHGRAARL